MKKYLVTFCLAILLVLPLSALANVDSSINVASNYSAGTDSQFDIVLQNFQPTNDLIGILAFSDTKLSDIKSASFLDKSGWVKLTPSQTGNDVVAKLISDTGFDSANGRTISFRVNFNTAKNYIVGYALQSSAGRIVSSAAVPFKVSGKVLGQTTNAAFTRSLKTGSRGADVSALQNLLTEGGFYSGPVSGYFGAQTKAAVKKYQIAQGIAGANGVVGPATLAVLNQ
ncbi:MAG: peptidoglycan-binding protein [Candidatus Doudnabacteria bacterium]|nr:peptidoglycan-binding protein [Candidatus Doudnabacteria bacterium]